MPKGVKGFQKGHSTSLETREDKLACKIQKESGCTWKEAFERASIVLFGGEE